MLWLENYLLSYLLILLNPGPYLLIQCYKDWWFPKFLIFLPLGPDLHDRDHHHHRQYEDHHQPHVNGDQQTNFGSEVFLCNTGSAERDLLSLSSRYSVVSTAPFKYSHCNFNGNYKTFSFYLNTIYKYSHSMRPSLYLNVICGLPTFSHQNL